MVKKKTSATRAKRAAKSGSEWSTAKKISAAIAVAAVPLVAAALARALANRRKKPARPDAARKR
jgi:hypothetical protein